MSHKRAIVLSDIHLGPGTMLTTFREQDALAAFLIRLGSEPGAPPTELILAGDTFDFLQLEGYKGFEARRSANQLEMLLANPPTAQVITALKSFASKSGNEVTVLAGNHDPEMLVPDVRRCFEEAISRTGSVFYPDDTPLEPRDGERLPVWGRALTSNGAAVWVVHGDRWDPFNQIDREVVLNAIARDEPVNLPPGSHLVFEVLSQVKPHHRWVDELKPELPTVLLLLLYLDPKRARTWLSKHLGLRSRLLRDFIQAKIAASVTMGPENSVASVASSIPHGAVSFAPEAASDLLCTLLAEDLRLEVPERRDWLLGELSTWLEQGAPLRSSTPTFAEHGGIGRLLLRTWLRYVRRFSEFHRLDAEDDIRDLATRYLSSEVKAVVAGHTHGARVRHDLRPAYFNTGTWIPVGRLPDGDLNASIDVLELDRSWPTAAPRTFAVIELGDGPPAVRLARSDADGRWLTPDAPDTTK